MRKLVFGTFAIDPDRRENGIKDGAVSFQEDTR